MNPPATAGRTIVRRVWSAVALLLGLTAAADAQMTVGGRVSGPTGEPIAGASVTIRDLGLATRTGADGGYNFIIASSRVRGQTVTILARHGRHGSSSATIAIVGSDVTQHFTLGSAPGAARDTARPINATAPRDTTRLDGSRAALSVAEALVGRITGLRVVVGAPDGSSPMLYRGPRSLIGPTQPLVVVDGVPLDNESYTSAMQRFGLGGFDYGTRLNDIAVEDVAAVAFVHGAAAVPLYGGRAANGVLVIDTKRRGPAGSLNPTAALRVSGGSAVNLPSMQDRYGQGRDGQFEFFDGRGAGINDGFGDSWGPALDGQPVPQFSLSEPNRPEVRHWLPHASPFDLYLGSASVADASVSVDLGPERVGGRLSFNARRTAGLTPGATASRFGAGFNGSAQPTARLATRFVLQAIGSSADNRPGTGFGEINSLAGFVRTPRSVDVDELRSPLMSGGEQLNWIYTDRNNPWIQPLRNTNSDSRKHLRGGLTVTADLASAWYATVGVGAEHSSEDRDVSVAAGWIGGYPTVFGPRDFADGGSERQSLIVGERSVSATLNVRPVRVGSFALHGTVGSEKRFNRHRFAASVSDTNVMVRGDTLDADALGVFAAATASRGSAAVDLGMRAERASHHADSLGWLLYPSATLRIDVGRAVPKLVSGLGMGAQLQASWWRAGNDLPRSVLRRAYGGWGSPDAPVFGLTNDSLSVPEVTTGGELGAILTAWGGRASARISLYSESTRDALVEIGGATSQTAMLTNRGVEGTLTLMPLAAAGAGDSSWTVAASLARNRNQVEQIGDTTTEVALAPSRWNVVLAAREGQPSGLILGQRYLRDASGALLLHLGLPLAEPGVSILGNVQPSWTGSLRNRVMIAGATVSLVIDGQVGGQFFSATNFWGSQDGTLAATLPGRETGRVIAGVDSTTGLANEDTVSVEAYYKALGSIHEAFVYDASFWKLRDLTASYSFGLGFVPGFREHSLTVSLSGRNLFTWKRAPNVDPEFALSTSGSHGLEFAQLPHTRSVALQLEIRP